VHQHFIDNVAKGRGDRLKGDRDKMFSGDFWEGSTAVKLGLADGIGNTWDTMKKEFNVKIYRNYSAKTSLLHMVLGDIEAQLHTTLTQQSHAELTDQLQ
jgi:ClpP class serine protease